MRVLLVEDDSDLGKAIEQALTDGADTVDWVTNGETALEAAATAEYSMILLDLGLPKRDGISVLKQLRQRRKNVPVLIITARDSVDDRIAGLDAGADDYLVKPFEVEELRARMRAVIRRHNGTANPILSNGIVDLDPSTRCATRDGKETSLSAREYALLHALMLRPGQVLSREALESNIYGWNEEVASNAIEFLIHGVRKKLGQDSIKNVRGLGWMVNRR